MYDSLYMYMVVTNNSLYVPICILLFLFIQYAYRLSLSLYFFFQMLYIDAKLLDIFINKWNVHIILSEICTLNLCLNIFFLFFFQVRY